MNGNVDDWLIKKLLFVMLGNLVDPFFVVVCNLVDPIFVLVGDLVWWFC